MKRLTIIELLQLRRNGKVILSVNTGINNGFFLPADRAEVERFAKTMHSRLKQIKLATLSAEKYLSEVNQ